MVMKTVVMLSMFILPFGFIISGLITSTWMLFVCFLIAGLGMSGIGMGVMHDAIHGTYSKNPNINRFLGYTMNLIGANATVWKIQHNVLHHSYTNIEDHDDDINTPFFLRFSPNGTQNGLHKFQHLYAWIFYGLSTVSWVTAKDFIRLKRYHKRGLVKGENGYRNALLELIAWKIGYYILTIVLPVMFSPFSIGMILLGHLAMHFITGLIITSVFQTAHIVPEVEFFVADEQGVVEGERMLHQLLTTCNFAPRSNAFSWFIGGLNHQIEHHLFPDICHVHYRNIAPIVKATAEEFNIPYIEKPTFFLAVKDHLKMLYMLGNEKLELVKAN
jgi:linoleoyl-CoA desaturase